MCPGPIIIPTKSVSINYVEKIPIGKRYKSNEFWLYFDSMQHSLYVLETEQQHNNVVYIGYTKSLKKMSCAVEPGRVQSKNDIHLWT